MVKALYAKAKESIAGFVENSKRNKAGERQFIIYYNKGDEFFVLGESVAAAAQVVDVVADEEAPTDHSEAAPVADEADDCPSRFKIEKGARISAALIEQLLRPALPLFHSTDIHSMRGRREHFHDDYVRYEVIRVNISGIMGIPEDLTPEQALEKNGFTIIPLAEHPHFEQLKTIVI